MTSPRQETHDIIEMLVMHEELIGELYKKYAERFPSYREFWSTLAVEEYEHAWLLRKLGKSITAGNAVCHIEKFKTTVVQESINMLKDILNRIHDIDTSLGEAFSRALTIEKMILDGKIFQTFEAFSLDAKANLRELTDALGEHVARIERLFSSYKSS
jgi:rubrerythrin